MKISIGQNQWIEGADRTCTNAVNIDDLMQGTRAFWRALELHCVPECCGVEAYSFWPDDVRGRSTEAGPGLGEALQVLRNHVDALDAQAVHSEQLNHCLDRTLFLRLLDHLIAHAA